MLMLDISTLLNHRRQNRKRCRGFTLAEVLVVIFLIGLLSAIIVPNLPLFLDRVDYKANRETILQSIKQLPYEAYKKNQNLILTGTHPNDESKNTNLSVSNNGLIQNGGSRYPAMYELINLELPNGWRVNIDSPIIFRPTGFCSGGELAVLFGSEKHEYLLQPPRCDLVESD